MTSIQNAGASTEAIRHHYDIGNNFYRLWLDESLTYSCALWEKGKENSSLELGQIQKIDFHVAQARAHGAWRVLDLGCGWGSGLRRMVEVHHVEQAVGLTLSEAQVKWISQLNHPRIKTCMESWKDHSPKERYDAIVSIEAFEHFSRKNLSSVQRIEAYRAFFLKCHEWLNSGGWLSLQTSACGNMHYEDLAEFIVSEIFPESSLPRLSEIIEASDRLFEVATIRNDRQDYVQTLRTWIQNLKAKRGEAAAEVGDLLVDRYERYLRQSLHSFKTGTTTLLRIALRRIDRPRT